MLLLSILAPILIVQIIIYSERFETRRRMELETNLEVAQAVAETFQGVVDDLLNQELLIGLALGAPSGEGKKSRPPGSTSVLQTAPISASAWILQRKKLQKERCSGM